MPWLGFFSASPALTDFRFSLKLMLCWYQCWCSCWPPWSPSCSHLYWEFVFVLIMKASLIFYLAFSSFSFSVLLCVQNIIAEKILSVSKYFFLKNSCANISDIDELINHIHGDENVLIGLFLFHIFGALLWPKGFSTFLSCSEEILPGAF